MLAVHEENAPGVSRYTRYTCPCALSLLTTDALCSGASIKSMLCMHIHIVLFHGAELWAYQLFLQQGSFQDISDISFSLTSSLAFPIPTDVSHNGQSKHLNKYTLINPNTSLLFFIYQYQLPNPAWYSLAPVPAVAEILAHKHQFVFAYPPLFSRRPTILLNPRALFSFPPEERGFPTLHPCSGSALSSLLKSSSVRVGE